MVTTMIDNNSKNNHYLKTMPIIDQTKTFDGTNKDDDFVDDDEG